MSMIENEVDKSHIKRWKVVYTFVYVIRMQFRSVAIDPYSRLAKELFDSIRLGWRLPPFGTAGPTG